jgi:DNA-binding transcriptional MerR regulator
MLRPVTAYKLDDLAREAQVPARTVRYYVQRGLLPAPDFRGKDTTYGDDHLLRLLAIKKLQQAHLPLDEIQVRVGSASRAELERLAKTDAVSALVPPPNVCVPPPGRVAPGHPYRRPPSLPPLPLRGEAWERIQIAPGVELHVRSDASAEALRIARQIEATYSGRT